MIESREREQLVLGLYKRRGQSRQTGQGKGKGTKNQKGLLTRQDLTERDTTSPKRTARERKDNLKEDQKDESDTLRQQLQQL